MTYPTINDECITYVLITKTKKNKLYKNELRKLSDHLYCLHWSTPIWKKDYYAVQKGTHIFYREKSTFYKYLGKVITKPLILEHTNPNRGGGLLIEFYVHNKNKPTICNKIDNNDQYKYQNACWRTLNLPPFKGCRRGVYKVPRIIK